MKSKILGWLFSAFFVATMIACNRTVANINCDGCEMQAVKALSDKLDEKNLNQFFCSLQSKCLKTNVEFSELANEQLFAALSTKPLLFIQSMEKVGSEQRRAILEMLESPINDEIDIKLLQLKIRELKMEGTAVKQIISALEIAQNKYQNTFKDR